MSLSRNKNRTKYIFNELEKATMRCSEKHCPDIYENLQKSYPQKWTLPPNCRENYLHKAYFTFSVIFHERRYIVMTAMQKGVQISNTCYIFHSFAIICKLSR